jgi:hypothetical protein
MKRGQDIGEELFMIFHEEGDKVFVCPTIGPQEIDRSTQRTMDGKGRSVFKGMGQGYFGLDPAKAVFMKIELPEEG